MRISGMLSVAHDSSKQLGRPQAPIVQHNQRVWASVPSAMRANRSQWRRLSCVGVSAC